jgi:hypothetical protein
MISSNKYQLTFAHQFLVLSDEHSSCGKVQSNALPIAVSGLPVSEKQDKILRSNIPDPVKADLMKGVDNLPVWMRSLAKPAPSAIVRNVCDERLVSA